MTAPRATLRPVVGFACVAMLVMVQPGCYHVTGQVEEKVAEIRTPSAKRSIRTSLPESNTVAVRAVFEGEDTVLLLAERSKMCRDDNVETFSVENTTERALPLSHWFLLGGGVAALVGGSASYAYGSSLESKYGLKAKGEIPNPSREEKADSGRQLMSTGIAVGAIGAAVLVSEGIDMWFARDGRAPLPPVETTTPGVMRVCAREPAASFSIQLHQGDQAVMLTTDAMGQVRASIGSEMVMLHFQRPFATIRCDGCEPVDFDLPPAGSARLVMTHRAKDELEAWLASFPSDEAVSQVKATLDEVVAEQEAASERARAAAAIAAAARLSSARRALAEKRFTDGQIEVAACLVDVPGEPACVAVRDELVRAEAASDLFRARQAIDRLDLYAASGAARHCLHLQPANPKCIAINSEIQRVIAATQADHVKDFSAYEEGDGYVIYFSLVDARGRYVAGRGLAELFLIFEKRGRSVEDVKIDSFEVGPTDFQRQQLGRGGFARDSLIVSKYLQSAQFFGRLREGRHTAKAFDLDLGLIYAKVVFTDPLGRKIEARELIHVK